MLTNYVSQKWENLNLEGHINCFIGSKELAILVKGGFYLGVELHREGSAPFPSVMSELAKMFETLPRLIS